MVCRWKTDTADDLVNVNRRHHSRVDQWIESLCYQLRAVEPDHSVAGRDSRQGQKRIPFHLEKFAFELIFWIRTPGMYDVFR